MAAKDLSKLIAQSNATDPDTAASPKASPDHLPTPRKVGESNPKPVRPKSPASGGGSRQTSYHVTAEAKKWVEDAIAREKRQVKAGKLVKARSKAKIIKDSLRENRTQLSALIQADNDAHWVADPDDLFDPEPVVHHPKDNLVALHCWPRVVDQERIVTLAEQVKAKSASQLVRVSLAASMANEQKENKA